MPDDVDDDDEDDRSHIFRAFASSIRSLDGARIRFAITIHAFEYNEYNVRLVHTLMRHGIRKKKERLRAHLIYSEGNAKHTRGY